jgi:hypothetical protein
MKPVISEEPRAWRKFMLQVCGLGVLFSLLLAYRGALSVLAVAYLDGGLALLALVATARPRWFRAFYRAAMIASAWLGERVGRVVLTVVFIVGVTPLALILKLCKYDPLARRRMDAAGTYWRPVRRSSRLDRMH